MSRWMVARRWGATAMMIAVAWASSGGAASAQEVEDLLDAVQIGRASVAVSLARKPGTEPSPAAPETLRLRVANPAQERRRFKLSGVYAAVPNEPGKPHPPPFARPSGDPPTNDEIENIIRDANAAVQPLLVGAVDGRGGLVGEQVVDLAPGQIREDIYLPVLRTQLVRPDASTPYRFVRVKDWTRDVELLALADHLARFGACQGAAQAALWKLTTGASLMQQRMRKAAVVNESEAALAEHLLAVAHDAKNVSPLLPAKAYIKVLNRSGEDGLDLTDEMRRIIGRGGLFGLPVELRSIDEAKLQTPSEFALALGCQLEIVKAAAAAGQPAPAYQVVVTMRFWTGREFFERRGYQVWLGPTPTPAEAVSLVEQGVLQQLVKLEAVSPERNAPAKEPPRLRITCETNGFPYALHSLMLRGAADTPQAGSSWTFRGLAVGPMRSIEIPFDGPIDRVKIAGVGWGH